MDGKRRKARKIKEGKNKLINPAKAPRSRQAAEVDETDLLIQKQARQAAINQQAKRNQGYLTSGDLLHLQRTIGNQTAGYMLKEMTGTGRLKPGTQIHNKEQAVIQRDLYSDLAELRERREQAAPGVYQDILSEALKSAERVLYTRDLILGGSVERRFTSDGDIAGYIVSYQEDADDATLRIANLVHELTHISVEKAYGSDLVNYPSSGERSEVPEPEYSALEVDPRIGQPVKKIENEEARQAKRMSDKANTILLGNLKALKSLVDKSDLTEEQKAKIKDKIEYGQINVSKEYDTVVNQIYMWCKDWSADTKTRFFQMLEAMVEDAYNRRKNKAEVTKRVPKGCYITTACMLARGLPDDCEELTVLRSFRDNTLLKRANGIQLLEQYYEYAPFIVNAIARRKDMLSIYEKLYQVIQACVEAIQRGDNEFAFTTYCDMVLKLRQEFAPEIVIPYDQP